MSNMAHQSFLGAVMRPTLRHLNINKAQNKSSCRTLIICYAPVILKWILKWGVATS